MSFRELPATARAGFLAGQAWAYRNGAMLDARDTTLPELRAAKVRYARECNHRLIADMRRAREIAAQLGEQS